MAHYSQKMLYSASKIPPANDKWPALPKYKYQDVFSQDHVLKYADQIRKRLRVDSIDLLQFHVWDDSWTDDPEFRTTVERLKRDYVQAFGLSLNRWEPANGIRAIRTGLVDAVQVIYNVFDQVPEDELFPVCRELNIAVIARVPFDEGSLTGTLTKESRWPDGDWRNSYFVPENLNASVERADALKPLVPAGMTMPEMALRFILNNPTVSTIIPGMRKLSHVESNISASDQGALPEELHTRLREHRWDR